MWQDQGVLSFLFLVGFVSRLAFKLLVRSRYDASGPGKNLASLDPHVTSHSGT